MARGQAIILLYAQTLDLKRVSCDELISRGPELAAYLGYSSTGIVKGSLAADGMSYEAMVHCGGVPSVREGGVTASLQSIGARGFITPEARRAIYIALKRMGMLSNDEYLVEDGHNVRFIVVEKPYYFASDGIPSLHDDYHHGGYNFRMAEMMLNDTILPTCKKLPTPCNLTCHSRFKVVTFERIENRKAFDKHKCYEARVAETMLRQRYCDKYTDNQPDWLKKLAYKNGLSEAANTVYLLHGTNHENLNDIVSHGLKTEFSLNREDLMYGKGLYFTDNACKASQYMGTCGRILVCRVVLGQQEVLPHPDPLRLFPTEGYHSTMGHKERSLTFQGLLQLHNEFIVYNECACYPEFSIGFHK